MLEKLRDTKLVLTPMVIAHKKLVSNYFFLKSCVYIVDLLNGCITLLAQCTCLYLPLTGEACF